MSEWLVLGAMIAIPVDILAGIACLIYFMNLRKP